MTGGRTRGNGGEGEDRGLGMTGGRTLGRV